MPWIVPVRDVPKNPDLAERVESILASKNLTLYQISKRSKAIYGRSSVYFVPHNLYYELRRGRFTPSIYQLAAFSHISGYRLPQWLRIFGFDVEEIPRLQILLPAKRTVLLDSLLIDPGARIAWLENRGRWIDDAPICPLTQQLAQGHGASIGSLPQFGTQRFLYAKIGCEDTLAFPDLLPGSIVRVDRTCGQQLAVLKNSEYSNRLFLVEHSHGLFCCRVELPGENLIVPLSNKLPYAQVELRFPQEVEILGVVDGEIRSLLTTDHPEVPRKLAELWKPTPLSRESRLNSVLRSARANMHLSLHEVSIMSRKIADLLRDDRYFISVSSLSDYESLGVPPRHFHKSISICVLYGFGLHRFLRALGVSNRALGRDAMPEEFISQFSSVSPSGTEDAGETISVGGGFLGKILARCEEIPFFMRRSLATISGLSDVSLDDFFWIGGETNPLHPYLINGLLVIVNRRKKKPLYFRSKPLWQQPIYLLLKRDGTYLCACCSIEGTTLVIHPYPQHFYRPTQFRNHDDAEIVGQIVTIARTLS